MLKDESDLHQEKDPQQSVSTLEGIIIDLSDELENASSPMIFNDDGNSKETNSRA
jgi:hypothetical protein